MIAKHSYILDWLPYLHKINICIHYNVCVGIVNAYIYAEGN